MDPKALFILLVVIIVLFAAVVVWGDARDDQPMPELPPAWLASIGSRFAEALQPEDLSGLTASDCRRQLEQGTFTLAPGAACRLVVKAASARQRKLALRFVEGPGATVAVDHASESRLDGTQEISSAAEKDSVDLYLFKEGGTVTLTCRPGFGAAPCVIETSEAG